METKTDVIEALRYARDVVLADAESWTQGATARDEGGHDLWSYDVATGKGVSFCSVGAVARTRWELGLSNHVTEDAILALDAAARDVGALHVPGFNDVKGRTHSEVIDLFDRAIKSLEDPA